MSTRRERSSNEKNLAKLFDSGYSGGLVFGLAFSLSRGAGRGGEGQASWSGFVYHGKESWYVRVIWTLDSRDERKGRRAERTGMEECTG
jgi:hypothetical protein